MNSLTILKPLRIIFLILFIVFFIIERFQILENFELLKNFNFYDLTSLNVILYFACYLRILQLNVKQKDIEILQLKSRIND
jgi:hypothetical protein